MHRVLYESSLGGHTPEHAQFKKGREHIFFKDRFSSKSRRRIWACSVCLIKMEGKDIFRHVHLSSKS